MILTMAKLAAAIDVAKNEFAGLWRQSPERLIGGFLMVSYLLQAMSLKTPEETIQQAMERLRQAQHTFDLLNNDDRILLSTIMKDMFGPLGVADVVILGLTPEGRVFITSMHDHQENRTIEEVKQLLRTAAESKDAEEFNL